MPCILLLLVLAFPRVILVLMFFFSNYLGRAYHNLLIPVLGFFFLPLTTIVYAWEVNSHMALHGGEPVSAGHRRDYRRRRFGRRIQQAQRLVR